MKSHLLRHYCLLVIITCFVLIAAQEKAWPQNKLTINIGPTFSVPGNKFIYSGSIFGIGGKAQLNYLLSKKLGVDFNAEYAHFTGTLKEYPGPKYLPKALSFLPGIKYYVLPYIFISANTGATFLGGVNTKNLSIHYAYAPSIGISFPSKSRRVNVFIGYVHIIDNPMASNYFDTGFLIRVF